MITSEVYDLRREGKKIEAYEYARRLYQSDPNDDDIKKALCWTLIDLCKLNLSVNNLSQAGTFLNQLENIEFDYADDFVDTIKKQTSFLKPKVDEFFARVKQIDDLSKNGRHIEALQGIQLLERQNHLKEVHHETYGWIIYRYIKAEEQNLTSVQVRSLLNKYLKLSNPRPSLLHSLILIFSVGYCKEHSDFNLYKFFVLWGPENLRKEDKEAQANDEEPTKTYPSLLSRLFREIIERGYAIDIELLIEKIKLDPVYKEELVDQPERGRRSLHYLRRLRNNYESAPQVLDFIREPIFWQLYKAQKEKSNNELWTLFENYNIHYKYNLGSIWHSKVLSLAERFMSKNEEWRFLKFFEEWGWENFLNPDWKEVKKEEQVYNGLAVKALKKAFSVLKSTEPDVNFQGLLQAYKKASEIFPDNEWILREKALLHIRNGEKEIAEDIFQKLALKLGTQYYIWQEYSECFGQETLLQIGMLAKALSLEKNEDFLGDIRLQLAKALIKDAKENLAAVELKKYKEHRTKKSWKLSGEYIELQSKIQSTTSDQKDYSSFYKDYIIKAEEYAFRKIDWVQVVLVSKWNSSKGQQMMKFSDGKELILVIPENKFLFIKKIQIGDIAQFKIYKKKTDAELLNIPLIGEGIEKEPWSILEETYVYVNYINRNSNRIMVHGITYENKEVFFPQDDRSFKVGEFLHSRFYIDYRDDSKQIELVEISKVEMKEALSLFPTGLGIVDHINEKKNLFHIVLNKNLQGIVKYDHTTLRPKEGDFLNVFYVTRRNKENKLLLEVIHIQSSNETDKNLVKEIEGTLEVKFKIGGLTYGYSELDYLEDDEYYDVKPSFGFIDDYYVPAYLLKKFDIQRDQHVEAKVLFSGEKWKVYDLLV